MEMQKVKTPLEYLISSLRLLLPVDTVLSPREEKKLQKMLKMLGQYPHSAPSPKGWSDEAADWLGGESMLRRLRLAEFLSNNFPIQNPLQLAKEAFGPLLTSNTRQLIRRAPDRRTALALLLASPEFQRR